MAVPSAAETAASSTHDFRLQLHVAMSPAASSLHALHSYPGGQPPQDTQHSSASCGGGCHGGGAACTDQGGNREGSVRVKEANSFRIDCKKLGALWVDETREANQI